MFFFAKIYYYIALVSWLGLLLGGEAGAVQLHLDPHVCEAHYREQVLCTPVHCTVLVFK